VHKPVRWDTGQVMREHNARNRFYHSQAWRTVRARVLKRDGYVCQLQLMGCMRRASTADHIVERRAGGSDDWTNLRAVCASCHNKRPPSCLGGEAHARTRGGAPPKAKGGIVTLTSENGVQSRAPELLGAGFQVPGVERFAPDRCISA
jgi:hypothetical protein